MDVVLNYSEDGKGKGREKKDQGEKRSEEKQDGKRKTRAWFERNAEICKAKWYRVF